MFYTIAPPQRTGYADNKRLYGVSGLGEEFNQSILYTIASTSTAFSDATLSTMFNSHRVGTYLGYPVLQDPATVKLYVFKHDEKLYLLTNPLQPTVVTSTDPNCPCSATNCREEVRQETWYASPTKTSDSDIAIPFVQDVVGCTPVDAPPVPACADTLAKLKATGVSGLGEIDRAAYSKCTKWCNDNTHGQDLINCYKKCDGSKNSGGGLVLSPANSNGYLTVSRNNGYYEPIPFTGLRGLGEDKTSNDVPVQYVEAGTSAYFTPPVATCDHSNLWVWGVLIFLIGNLTGWLINTAAKKR